MSALHKISDYSVKLDKDKIPKSKLKKLTEKSKNNTDNNSPFISEKHKEYCRTYDMAYIEKPIVKTISWVFIPFKYLVHENSLSLDKAPVFAHMFPSDEDPGINIVDQQNNYNMKFLQTQSLTNNIVIHYPWFKQQQEYIMSLPMRYIYTLRGYTYTGDVLANTFLRGSFDRSKNKSFIDTFIQSEQAFMPLFFQIDESIKNATEFADVFENSSKAKSVKLVHIQKGSKLPNKLTVSEWFAYYKKTTTLKNSEKYTIILSVWPFMNIGFVEKCIAMFIDDLQVIFKNAPALKKEMTVYRGVKDDFYLRGSKNGFYKNIGFVSTSMDYTVAEDFRTDGQQTKQELGCCIQSIKIKPGTRVVPLIYISSFGGEKEILLNHGSIYHINDERNVKVLYNNQDNAASSICFKRTHKVVVSDITLA